MIGLGLLLHFVVKVIIYNRFIARYYKFLILDFRVVLTINP